MKQRAELAELINNVQTHARVSGDWARTNPVSSEE